MKAVPLINDLTITVHGNPVQTSYRELIALAVQAVPPGSGGIQVDEIRRRIRVIDALEALEPDVTVLHLEDADYEKLVACVKAMPWNSTDRAILKFCDDMISPPAQSVMPTTGT